MLVSLRTQLFPSFRDRNAATMVTSLYGSGNAKKEAQFPTLNKQKALSRECHLCIEKDGKKGT